MFEVAETLCNSVAYNNNFRTQTDVNINDA